MVRLVEAKAARSRSTIRAITSSAEELSTDGTSFELITIGNAFHRLHRGQVARRAFEWLRPGGHLALCWSDSPWSGQAEWQQTLNDLLQQWSRTLNTHDRLPQDWESDRQARPDLAVLADAGFESQGRHQFHVAHRWTVADLAGFVYSTSFLAAPMFGDRAPAFEADLADHLAPQLDDGVLVEDVSFAYDLVRKPAS